MSTYIKIRAFSEQFGISRQAVYQRIKKDWAPYIKKVDGETLISIDAAADLSPSDPSAQELQPRLIESNSTDELINSLKDQLTSKDRQISELQVQIMQLLKINQDQFTHLNDQIVNLQKQNEHQSQHIMQQSERLSVLLSQQQYLTHTIAAEGEDQPISDTPSDDVYGLEPDSRNIELEKTSFWHRIFKR